MPVVVSIASGKGGVGKTTTVANIAVALGNRGLSVLTWDMDGQGNLGQALGVEASSVHVSSYHLMAGRVTQIETAIQATPFRGVSCIAAHMELFAAEQELPGSQGKEYIMRTLLQQPQAQKFDLVLIDLPPNLGFHTVNGFAASRFVLVPLQVSGFALSGLRQLAHAIRLAQQYLNPELEMLGLVPTFVNERTHFSRELLEALRLLPETRVFAPYIPYTVRVAEGSITGVPVVASAPGSVAGKAYAEVATSVWEVIRSAPEHVTHAPSPSIASPPRADTTVSDIAGDRPAEASAGRASTNGKARRSGLFGWLRRSRVS
ncbi:MAG: AAA family ATPase [Candidatus Dormibacteraeota bacterium]|nr:AAA family ATPase [Candidatus Dormibacteraeota bacterium]